jgi:hypothetical protein
MGYTRELSDGTQLDFIRGNAQLGGLGWTVKYLGAPEGHERITRNAIGRVLTISFTVGGSPRSRVLTPAEVVEILRGNTDTDLLYFRRGQYARGAAVTFLPSDQKHHALRGTYFQPQPSAFADIVRELRAQHAGILVEPNRTRQLYKIGHATHLIQDSFSPAHTQRVSPTWCVRYIRNYGVNLRRTDEHQVPKDPRDEVARSAAAAAQAEHATRLYLQIVFKAIYGKTRPDPVASREAAAELNSFIATHFRTCLSSSPAVPGPVRAAEQAVETGQRIVREAEQIPGQVVRGAERAAREAAAAGQRFVEQAERVPGQILREAEQSAGRAARWARQLFR